jgi:hypothetical protein
LKLSTNVAHLAQIVTIPYEKSKIPREEFKITFPFELVVQLCEFCVVGLCKPTVIDPTKQPPIEQAKLIRNDEATK